MLDADEELSGDSSGLISFLQKITDEIDAIALMFRDIQGGRQHMQFPQPRIFRRWRVRWENIVHNRPVMREPAILFPDLSIMHYGYDDGEETKAKKTARTMGLLKKQLEIDPDSHWVHFYLAQIYGDNGQLDECISASESYIACKPRVDRFNTSVYFTLCQACMAKGDMELSDKWIGEAVRELPDDIDIAAVVFDFGIKTQRPAVILSGASMFLAAYDKLQASPCSMGSRFTYTNRPEALARVLYQVVAMRLEESIVQLDRLKKILPACEDSAKRETIETELRSTLSRLGVRWLDHGNAEPQKEAA